MKILACRLVGGTQLLKNFKMIYNPLEEFSSPKIFLLPLIFTGTQCLKITEKVSINIASEASYVYILSGGQKLIKNAQNGPFWRVFENLKLAVKQCYQTGQF